MAVEESAAFFSASCSTEGRPVRPKQRVANLHVNHDQTGVLVDSQLFGGEGLSGTGPKAGGPHYIARFAIERGDVHRQDGRGRQGVIDGGARRLDD